MRVYIIKRLLLAIPTTFLVTVVIFLIVRLVPDDAVDALAVQLAAQGVNVEMVREDVERMLGLDVPVVEQYGRWLGVVPQADGSFSGLFHGNLGRSR